MRLSTSIKYIPKQCEESIAQIKRGVGAGNPQVVFRLRLPFIYAICVAAYRRTRICVGPGSRPVQSNFLHEKAQNRAEMMKSYSLLLV